MECARQPTASPPVERRHTSRHSQAVTAPRPGARSFRLPFHGSHETSPRPPSAVKAFEAARIAGHRLPHVAYLTDHYRRHPVVLARLARLDPVALHDLLSISWRLTAAKTKKRLR